MLDRYGDAIRFHPGLLEIAGALRVQPRLCRPRRPTDKGGVERAIRYLRDRFFAARTITSIEDGNRQLLAFVTYVANIRPHPQFKDRLVGEVFKEEKERLLALPDVLPSTELVVPANVDTMAFVRFGTNAYSVPSKYARSRDALTLVASDTELRLLDGTEVVARHERCWGKHQRVEDPAHRADLLAQKRRARTTKARDRLLAEVPSMEALYTRWVEVGRNIGFMTARVVKLLDLYGADILREAVTMSSREVSTIRARSRSAARTRGAARVSLCPSYWNSQPMFPRVTSFITTSPGTISAGGRDEHGHHRRSPPSRPLRTT